LNEYQSIIFYNQIYSQFDIFAWLVNKFMALAETKELTPYICVVS